MSLISLIMKKRKTRRGKYGASSLRRCTAAADEAINTQHTHIYTLTFTCMIYICAKLRAHAAERCPPSAVVSYKCSPVQ